MIDFVRLQQKYPRLYDGPDRRSRDLMQKAEECIHRALDRKPERKEFQKGIHRLCGTIYNERFFLLSYLDPIRSFLCAEPSDLEINEESDELLQEPFSFKCHPFNEKELEIMNQALLIMEPWFGDPIFSFGESEETLPDEFWKFGMSEKIKFYYEQFIYPMIENEIVNLRLEEGALICDPACGTGELIAGIKKSFPDFTYSAADRNSKVTRIAQIRHRDFDILAGDAKDMSYLEPKSVELFVFSGLLNESVVNKETGRNIIERALLKAKDYAYLIITGRTLPLFSSDELLEQGLFPLLRTKWHAFHFFPFCLCLAIGKEDGIDYLSVTKDF